MQKKNSFSINIVFLVFSIMGIALLPMLTVQLKPNHQGESVHVSFEWGNVSAEVVEKEVTSPIEGALAALKGVKDVSSSSYKGGGRVSLTFKEDVDMDAARFEVSSVVKSIYKNLPEGVSRPSVSYKKYNEESDLLLIAFNINGEGSNYQLQKYAEEHIVTYIGQIEEVSNVMVGGATPPICEMTYNQTELLAVGLSVKDLRKSISKYLSSKELGASVLQEGEAIYLTFKGQSSDTVSWDEVILTRKKGRLIRLTDVVTIHKKELKSRSYYRLNGLNTIYMTVYSAKGANQVELAKEVNEKLEELKARFPDNFSVTVNYDASKEVKEEIQSIILRAGLTILILLLFVFLISRRLRYLLIIFFSLAANLLIGVVLYYFLGIEMHIYSLAGITVSLGIIIDNTIVMVDHIRYSGNKKAFLAILAATLTTIGALVVIFFLKEEQRLNLVDFSLVMIINLVISLFVALWFIPALMDKMPLDTSKGLSKKNDLHVVPFRESKGEGEQKKSGFLKVLSFSRINKKRTWRWSCRYQNYIRFTKRWRWAFIIAAIWGFGLPIFLIPEEIKIDERKGEEATWWTDFYNSTLGNETYVSNVRPWINKILGGSINYFSSYMAHSDMSWEDNKTVLRVNISMPDGATLEQMNEVCLNFENYLAKFSEISRFVANVRSIEWASIDINFTEEAEMGSFPYVLKQELEIKAIETGSADFSIVGVGRGFNNSLYEGSKSCRIELTGYNFDQLKMYAKILKDTLLLQSRIKEVFIKTSSSRRSKPRYEYVMQLNLEQLTANNSSIYNVYGNLSFYNSGDVVAGSYYEGKENISVFLTEKTKTNSSIWYFKNNLLYGKKGYLRLKDVGDIGKERVGDNIIKRNQRYSINVEYDFIGPHTLSRMVLERNVENLKKELPLGYSVKQKRNYGWWNYKEPTQYWLLLLVIGIIYFICAILLESLVQPLTIILMIPISFIGVFLTFATFELKFDQGGYASMILLCGITVNSALYIINDYNNNRRNNKRERFGNYLKAYNHKITPIFLTVLSTMLGMVPFLLGGQVEGFWFSLAVGAIGGLFFSVLAIVVWLPLFMNLEVISEQ